MVCKRGNVAIGPTMLCSLILVALVCAETIAHVPSTLLKHYSCIDSRLRVDLDCQRRGEKNIIRVPCSEMTMIELVCIRSVMWVA